jgi:hypothetical protein
MRPETRIDVAEALTVLSPARTAPPDPTIML